DVVELQLHGSPKVLQQVLELLVSKCSASQYPSESTKATSEKSIDCHESQSTNSVPDGCRSNVRHDNTHFPKCTKGQIRLAEPGEFTKRALLNGKLDLAQAEAVADLIDAKTMAASSLASRHLSGELSDRISMIREQLADLLTSIQANLNFPEDDVPDVQKQLIAQQGKLILDLVTELTANSRHAFVYRDGLPIALVGLPNAGKSSLFNALLGHDRAIVSTRAGTTRDSLEEMLDIRGVPVILTDTAGITSTEDEIEQLGIQRSIRAIEQALLVLLVWDVKEKDKSNERFLSELDQEVQQILTSKTLIRVFNKIDTVPAGQVGDWAWDQAWVSAKTGQGLEQLRDYLVRDYLDGGLEQGNLLVTNARQQQDLHQAKQAVLDALQALDVGFDIDTVSLDLQRAQEALGRILGLSVDEDVIDQVFGRFCIGK
ncbi:MAG TPA: tRNA uridine-5-carboxymethylaminomethyl(34) synthesis GTPase MnmE, partial [Candidatus Wirthbacteria bacterium]|nr:tRNA uridine-5-carboxymethylaminomethyl(34) synthesis GTPase MnmE [Candidatus Wirthbacteria bacterium]